MRTECTDARGSPQGVKLLRVSPTFPNTSRSPRPAAQVGQSVWGVGNPHGLDHTLTQVCIVCGGYFWPPMELTTKNRTSASDSWA